MKALVQRACSVPATYEPKPYLPAPAPLILHSKGQERGRGKDKDTALPGCHHSALTPALQQPPLLHHGTAAAPKRSPAPARWDSDRGPSTPPEHPPKLEHAPWLCRPAAMLHPLRAGMLPFRCLPPVV